MSTRYLEGGVVMLEVRLVFDSVSRSKGEMAAASAGNIHC